MIRIVARYVIKKECIQQYHALVRDLVEATRKEKGCIVYCSNQSIQDERIHCFLEDWEDQASIDAHMKSEHFTRIVPQFTDLLAEEAIMDLYKMII